MTIENLSLDSPLDYAPNIGPKGMTLKTVISNAFAIGEARSALLAGKMKRLE